MFRKYYKDANNDIKPNEELLSRVIKNTHKAKPPSMRVKYLKYAVPVAAAFVVVSAAVISMPFFEKTGNDGVIIEERTVETSSPNTIASISPIASEPPSSITPVPKTTAKPVFSLDDYDNSQKPTVKPQAQNKNTSQHSYNDYNNSNSNFSSSIVKIEPTMPVISTVPKFEEEKEREDKEEVATSDNGVTAEKEEAKENVMFSSVVISEDRITEQNQEKVIKEFNENSVETASKVSPENENLSNSSTGDIVSSGGASSPIAEKSSSDSTYKTPSIPAPSGFYMTESYYGFVAFESDNGSSITVTYSHTDGKDEVPVYSEMGEDIYVSFTSDGVLYDISSAGASRNSIEEIVNSIV